MALAPAEAGNSEAPGIAKGRDAHVRSGDLARPVADERPERGAQRDEADGGARPQPAPEVRFLDWNPDVREAARVGGTINYSSHDNLVHCDGCRTEISRDDDRADSSSSSDASGSGSESGSDASSSQGSFGIDSGERGDRETPERPDKPQNR
jgi:hypothetical protein